MKNKTTAALLAFFLGGLGIHRFYLGQTGNGILYVLFSWTGIPIILGIIDSINFLGMKTWDFDEKFNKKLLDQFAMDEKLKAHHKAGTVDKSILEIFNVDLTSFPDDSFMDLGETTNEHGEKIARYGKKLKKGNFINGLFSDVQINAFPESESMNVIMSHPNIIEKYALADLVRQVVDIYGMASNNGGYIDQDDYERIDSGYWVGRNWLDESDKITHEIMISYDNTDKFRFSIYGVKFNK